MTEMDDWLKKLGLEEYSSVLAKNDIDFDVLLEFGERDLEKLGFSLGHRRKLMRAIEARKLALGPRPSTLSPETPAGTTAARDAERQRRRSVPCVPSVPVRAVVIRASVPLREFRALGG